MNDKKEEKYLNPTPISKEIYPDPAPSKEIYPESIPEQDFELEPTFEKSEIPSIPDFESFEELSRDVEINKFGEINREKGKSM